MTNYVTGMPWKLLRGCGQNVKKFMKSLNKILVSVRISKIV